MPHAALILLSRACLAAMGLAFLALEHARTTRGPLAMAWTWVFSLGMIGYAILYDGLEYEDGGNATISWTVHAAQARWPWLVPLIWLGIGWWPTHWTVVKAADGSVDWPRLLSWAAIYAGETAALLILGGTALGQRR